MKTYKFICCFWLFVFFSCSEPEEPLIFKAPIIDASNRQPTADYITEYGVNYPRTDVTFISKSFDPEGRILEYGWIINGTPLSGRSVTVSFEQPGDYSVVHFVRDEEHRIAKNGSLHISDYPRILVRLQYLEFSVDVGDGPNKDGEVYLVGHGIAPNRSGPNPPPQQTIIPGKPDDTNPWKMVPYSRNFFGPNSGLVLFDGTVTDLFGLSLVAIDHDQRGFDWTGLFSKILDVAATIVAPLEPITGTVLEGLSKISSIVGEFIKEPEDDVIASFQAVYTPKQRWGIDQYHELNQQNGTKIGYSIEVVP